MRIDWDTVGRGLYTVGGNHFLEDRVRVFLASLRLFSVTGSTVQEVTNKY